MFRLKFCRTQQQNVQRKSYYTYFILMRDLMRIFFRRISSAVVFLFSPNSLWSHSDTPAKCINLEQLNLFDIHTNEVHTHTHKKRGHFASNLCGSWVGVFSSTLHSIIFILHTLLLFFFLFFSVLFFLSSIFEIEWSDLWPPATQILIQIDTQFEWLISIDEQRPSMLRMFIFTKCLSVTGVIQITLNSIRHLNKLLIYF